ncbi:ABC transporter ATP-binding protein [Periweissella fabalis]|uniref:ATP-binding cassette domain-containing protein n=1 Tax=Periweissella fabalis TaxID=1070421 RepID=A0A7X6S248_9LACO|nr:ATP-binding cassette domain-containing protein [Periweissella fabalis]MCM0599306.1 ATP-binding cassette domain-containing protein [Periweissella fabalis]NKZ23585.1 ATP-binding cassette domain-containing protein [Periweissella fabalis]
MQFELNDVGITRENKVIISNINLAITKGDYLTIIGPSGSGKSTILKVMASLTDPTSGLIKYNGQNILTLNPINYRREVSYCVQQPTLFGDTVRDNLAFPFQIRKIKFDVTKAETLLQEAHMDASYLDHPIENLSGGERQRIALLRNIIFKPQVLLLDEVTTGLDYENKAIIHNLIQQMNVDHQTTIIQITHDETEITQAKQIIEVNDGHLVTGGHA